MLNACGRDLRCHHREARTRARKGLHIFRVEHGGSLHLVTRGDQRQLLDLPDINAQVADGHAFRQLAGIKRVQGNLPAHGACGGLGREENSLIAFTQVRARAAEVIEANRPAQRA